MTAYEVRISDWSSDVCSSDRRDCRIAVVLAEQAMGLHGQDVAVGADRALLRLHAQLGDPLLADGADRAAGEGLEPALVGLAGADLVDALARERPRFVEEQVGQGHGPPGCDGLRIGGGPTKAGPENGQHAG